MQAASTEELYDLQGSEHRTTPLPTAPLDQQTAPTTSVLHTALCIFTAFIVLIAGVIAYDYLHDDIPTPSLSAHLATYQPETPVSPSSSSHETLPTAIEATIDRIVDLKLRDRVGRRDFALSADGGTVVDELTVPLPNRGSPASPQPPKLALLDDMRIGKCWRVPSQNGQLAILSPHMIYPTHAIIDHIPIEIAADIGEAPKTMFLWGMVDGKLNYARYLNLTSEEPAPSVCGRRAPPLAGDDLYILLATFEYDINSLRHVQTFPIDLHIVYSRLYFGIFVFEIVDNWGSATTCIYRVRIHGDVAET